MLRESEEKYRLIVQRSHDGIAIIQDNRISFINRALAEMTGFPEDLFIGKPFLDFIWPEDRDRVREAYANPFCGDRLGQNQELRLTTAKGEALRALLSVAPIPWEGSPAVVALLSDITPLKKTEAELREKTEELERYFSSSLDLLCIADTDGHFLRVNSQWEEILGYPVSELEGRRFLDFVHPDDIDATLAALSKLRDQEEVLNFENRYLSHDGTYRWIEWRSKPRGSTIYAVARDITIRKRAMEALAESEDRFRKFFLSSPVSILIHDSVTGDVVDANPKAWEAYGLGSLEELKAYKIWLEPPFSAEDAREWIRKTLSEGNQRVEWKSRRKNGEIFWEEVTLTSLVIDGVRRILSTAIDITERKKVREELYRVSILDPLTGLYNRRFIFERLEIVITEYQRVRSDFSVALIDLDFFKRINDSRGHQAGDFVLKEFAGLLKAGVRPYDLVGRYGGEEYIIISEHTDIAQTETIIARIRDTVRRHSFVYQGETMKMTFSAGIAHSEEVSGSLTPDLLIESADKRLYTAKERGRDQICAR